MKKSLLWLIGITVVIASSILFMTKPATLEDQSNLKEDSIETLREKHAKVLENSPFKERLRLTKAERKAQGLPPNKYFEQVWELTVNPSTGQLDEGELVQIQNEIKASRSGGSNGFENVTFSTPGESSNAWSERGPNDIGGRTRAMLFDPNDASNRRVYAGGVSGGLWVNNDITSSASSWTRIQNVPGNLSVTSFTVDPNNSNRWFIGTGEQYTGGDVVGNGVYVTNDGGNSWNAVDIPAAGSATFEFNATNLFLSGLFYVNDVQAWNNNGNTELFVAVGANIYGDAGNPSNWLGLQTAGIYHSTNGGSTWNRIESANLEANTSGATTFYAIPNDFEVGADNTLWMGTINNAFGAGGGQVFRSNNGTTWTAANASPLPDSNRVEIEVSSSNPNRLYALTQGVSSPVHIYGTTNAFGSISTLALPNDADNGIAANDFTRGQAFYDLMIEVDPTNDNILYVGGIDLFRSTNGASSWTQISKWSNNPGLSALPVPLVHADQHAMTFRPGNSNQAVFGNDGGIFYASSLSTAQNNGTAIGVRNNNYNVTQYVKAGIGPDGPGDLSGIFTAGAQDNGSQAFRNTSPGINGSEELSDGDGFYTFVDKDGQYMIATFVFNVIYRFNLPWNGLGRRQGGATTLSSDQSRGDFVNPMDYDSDANRLLTNNSNATQNAIKSINVAANTNGSITNATLTASPTAFRASPFTNNEWLVGLENGRLIRLTGVTNNNANFTTITTPFVGSVSSVRYGETTNDIMVTIHNYGVVNVWSSSDGGISWQNKEGNLPNLPVRDILQNPLSTNEVILGTQLGVWRTNDFNSANPTWTQAFNGMSDASVTSFDYWAKNGDDNNNIVIASTYGRGVFTGSFTGSSVVDFEAPSTPTNLVASNITGNSIDLSWDASTDNVEVTGYDVIQDGILVATVAGTSYQVTGLSLNTSYVFNVKARDAAGNISGDSNAANVTTLSSLGCVGGVSTFPYSESFENNLGLWTQGTNNDIDWIRDANGTPSNGTGPTSAIDGNFYMYVEASGNGTGFPNMRAILNSPCFDLTGLAEASFNFQYHMFGSNDFGTIDLEISIDSGANWTSIWSQSGNQGNQWLSANIDLTAYVGGGIQLRFNRVTGGIWQADFAFDNVNLKVQLNDTTAPSIPTNLNSSNITETTVDLAWDASTDDVGVTDYEVLQDNNVIALVTVTNFQVTNLLENTNYAFNVRARDAVGNTSSNSNTINISTLQTNTSCTSGVNTFPYSESFESNLGLWTQSTADDIDWTRDANGTPSNGTGPSSGIDGDFYMYVEASGNGTGFPNMRAILNSPCIDLTGLSEAAFNFQYHMFGSNDFGTVDLEISDDDGQTWTSIWNRTGNQGNQWIEESIDLSSYLGSSIQLRFNRVTGGIWQADFAFDDVSVTSEIQDTQEPINDLLLGNFFETGFEDWLDGGGDCSRYSGDRSAEGDFSIFLRDNSGVASSMTTASSYDLTPYDNVEIKFSFFANSMENGEDFWLRYNDGSGFVTVETYARGVDFDNNAFYDVTFNMDASQFNLTNNGSFRIQCDASGNADRIYIDAVTIRGMANINSNGNSLVETGRLSGGQEDFNDGFNEEFEGDFKMFPNPAIRNTTIQLGLDIENEKPIDVILSIYDLSGKVIKQLRYNQMTNPKFEETIDVSDFSSGVYMIDISSSNGMREIQKLIIK